MVTETKPKSRTQLVEEVRQSVLDGKWEESIELNQKFLERFPRDADAYNRLGRSLLALKRYSSAYEAYSTTLKIDPANMIARRNLQRLEMLRRTHGSEDQVLAEGDSLPIIPRTNVFIEEVGKTWVAELVNPVSIDELADVYSGEQLELVVEGQRLYVDRANGDRLGEIEVKTAERVIQLLADGNRYEVYALGLGLSSLRVILREVFRDPRQGTKVSFPRQIAYTRAYLRDRDQLRQRDEADFLFSDEDDEDSDDDDSGTHAPDDDSAHDSEPDAFEEDPIVVEEDAGM
jgi:tetratricopeptide (TPR) repeat protein